MYVKTDNYGYITVIAKDPENDSDAQNLKKQGYTLVHPLDKYLPYMANFANKFRVNDDGVILPPDNLPLTPIEKKFNQVTSQLEDADAKVSTLQDAVKDLKSTDAQLVDDNKQLTSDAVQAKRSAAASEDAEKENANVISGLVTQLFQMEQVNTTPSQPAQSNQSK